MNPIHILLVKDNEGDLILTGDALEEYKIITQSSIARDGKEALDFLDTQLLQNNDNLPDLPILHPCTIATCEMVR